MVTRVSILGATGSIGASTLDLLRRDRALRSRALTAKRDAQKLGVLAREFGAKLAVVADAASYRELKDALAGAKLEAAAGREGLLAAAKLSADVAIAAITGAAGLEPTMAALSSGRRIALATRSV
jgi:1-deoxy-D-xylulose-5-phosphate reductoisomerase